VTHDQEEAFALADRIGVMNLGRLLEVGRPDELYARPATRFVATFLGAANLLLARQTSEGIHVGATPISARAQDRNELAQQMGREHEVVAVLRPEEVELAPTREQLTSTFLGVGTVQSKLFTGALERLRIATTSCANNNESATIDVTRTQHEQRLFQLAPGHSVAIGLRRIHVLPTPLSSFTVFAPTDTDAQALRQHSLLDELVTRMKTKISTRVEPQLGLEASTTVTSLPGVAVISGENDALSQTQWLLDRGAAEVFILPSNSVKPQRVLIHWTDDAARRGTLAVAASVLRHVPAEAMYLGILPDSTPETQRPSGMRELLDARSEAQAMHGLDMRTELRFGNVAQELKRQLTQADEDTDEVPPQMLILGITDPKQLTRDFSDLFAVAKRSPVLIVCRPTELPRVGMKVA